MKLEIKLLEDQINSSQWCAEVAHTIRMTNESEWLKHRHCVY